MADSRSEWHGDKTNGIEMRYQGDDLDEVCLYVDGRCVFHSERMSDQMFWMGLYAKNHTAHVQCASVAHKAHVCTSAEGWADDNT